MQRRIAEAIALAQKGERGAAAQIFLDLLAEAPGDLWVLDAAHAAGVPLGPRRLIVWAHNEPPRRPAYVPGAHGPAASTQAFLKEWEA